MGWVGDIAMVGVVLIGGWYVWSNKDKLFGGALGGGGAGAGTEPPAAEGEGNGTGVPDTNGLGQPVDKRADVRALFEKKHKLSSLAECVSASITAKTMKSCKCVKEGKEVAMIQENKDGIRCPSSVCGKSLTNPGKPFGKCPSKCKCTFPEAAQQYAKAGYITSGSGYGYAAYSAYPMIEYAHGFPRTRLVRARDEVQSGN